MRQPTVTYTIMAVTVVSWVLQFVLAPWFGWWAFSPEKAQDEPYRFITTAFLHSSNITHIVFNMYALWVVGPYVERALGRLRFTALYFIAAFGGSVGVLLLSGGPMSLGWYTAAIGASGAVFGLFAATFVIQRKLGQNGKQIAILIAINFALGFIIANISWQAHLGGMVVGGILAAGYVSILPRRAIGMIAVSGVMLVVLTAVSMAVYAHANGVLALLQS